MKRQDAKKPKIFIIVCLEVRIQRVHLEESILMDGDPNRVDPDKWRPLMMSFQKFYGLEPQQLHDSTLAQIPEYTYRSPQCGTSLMAFMAGSQ